MTTTALLNRAARTTARAARRSAALAALFLAAAGVTLHAQTPSSSAGSRGGAQTTVAAPGTAPLQPRATRKLGTVAPPRYDNRWEAYGGLLYMNGQAGQNLPRKYSMGGGEAMATYWLGSDAVKKWGVAVDYRIGAGTSQTGLIGATYGLNRILVMQHVFSGGAVYRTPWRNRYAAVDFHALAGGAYGIFDHALTHYPGYPNYPPVVACPSQVTATKPLSLGMYCNGMTPWGAAGGSIDFNASPRLAIRVQPDITFEHFGTETREFFAISAGAMYRFGK